MRHVATNKIRPLCVVFVLLGWCCAGCAQYKYPFQNPGLSAKERIHSLLSLMTLQEKINLLGKTMNIPRLGVHACGKIDSLPGSSGQFEGLHGLALGGPGHWGRKSPGTPAMGGTSTITTTQFPQATGLAETWNPALVEKAAAEEGREARYVFQSFDRGGLIVRSPNTALARDPRWGRLEETYGEDPFLTGTMAVAFVRGLQGSNPQYWQAASLVKHFLANTNEDHRFSSSSNFGPRLLHEYYAFPWKMVIKQGGADAVMASYNAVNGIPMATSPLLRKLLIKQWGLNGIIDTDRGALTFMVTKHKYYPNVTVAAAGAIDAGVNQFLNPYQAAVKAALRQKLITVADINRSVAGVLRVMLRLGFLDAESLRSRDPYTKVNARHMSPPWDQSSTKRLVLKVTEQSVVLLKNSPHLLPIDPSKVKSIAVLGPMANAVYSDGYGGTPPFALTPLQGIRAKVGARVAVRYSPNESQAIKLARESHVAIVFVGNKPFCHMGTAGCPNPTEGQEAYDRPEIHLPLAQERLIRKVYAANRRTIVVLVSSFPFTINWAEQHVPSIVNIAQSSEEEGAALANVLFGGYDPAGRLVLTWPRSIKQLPPMMDYNIRDGRTYMYFRGRPLFPFGYGLSYTTFRYSDLEIREPTIYGGQTVKVHVRVTNTGSRPGNEVVQLYVHYLRSKVTRPRIELVGFKRVSVPVHQSRLVTIPLKADALRYWSSSKHAWVLEKCKVRLMIGGSSRDIKLSKVVNVQ